MTAITTSIATSDPAAGAGARHTPDPGAGFLTATGQTARRTALQNTYARHNSSSCPRLSARSSCSSSGMSSGEQSAPKPSTTSTSSSPGSL